MTKTHDDRHIHPNITSNRPRPANVLKIDCNEKLTEWKCQLLDYNITISFAWLIRLECVGCDMI